MLSSGGGILLFLSIFGIVTSNADRAVDCRKFVFAPLCRGVAAKRGNAESANPIIVIHGKRVALEDLLKNLYYEAGMEKSQEDVAQFYGLRKRQEDVARFYGLRKRQEDKEKVLRKYLKGKDDGFYRILL